MSGELAHYLLPELPPNAPSSPLFPADANTWYRVVVLGKLRSIANRKVDSGGSAHERPGAGVEPAARAGGMGGTINNSSALTSNSSNGNDNSSNINDTSSNVKRYSDTSCGDSSSFVVEFENNGKAVLDLSRYSIRWISFDEEEHTGRNCSINVGGDRSSGVGGGGGGGGNDGRTWDGINVTNDHDANVDVTTCDSLPRRPPGFTGLDGTGASLLNNNADIGVCVDVWWPRYNSYFRAEVSSYGVYLDIVYYK